MSQAAVPSHIRSYTVAVKDSFMHYLEAGDGPPIVFLHGNPTSSYLWRNVIPHVEAHGRCIAVDCIGMGRSGKPDIGYSLADHIDYVDAFLDALHLTNVTFVAHDWGVAIGLALAARRPTRAIAFMEGHIHPIARWDDFDADSRTMFQNLRSETLGPPMIIDDNFFIETILPGGTQRALSHAEMEAYRAPFRERASRLPMLRWVGQIPIEGQPAEAHAIVAANQAFLVSSDIPKLLLYAHPGAVIGAEEVSWCMEHCSNLATVGVGDGIHFLPEDHPHAIGSAVAQWLDTL
ncbi:MAG TPA: haloalkane dehalogenase [Roseiflexaceae bacterium]|nr:haloalkane dehalogenase [Roseiflexaceae bacterium]